MFILEGRSERTYCERAPEYGLLPGGIPSSRGYVDCRVVFYKDELAVEDLDVTSELRFCVQRC